MKLNSLILGAAALMLATSCSNDEVVQIAENSKAIGFSSFVNNSTRASSWTEGTLTTLQAYGVEKGGKGSSIIFNGYDVTKNGSAWTYTGTPQYWINGFDYSFAAVAPAHAAGVEVKQDELNSRGGIKTIEFNNTNGDVDLLFDFKEVPFSTEEGTAWGNVVGFNLRHILSRVKFSFYNNVKEGYEIKVSDVKITNTGKSGSFEPNEEVWTIKDDQKETLAFNFVDAENETPAVTEAQAAYQADALETTPTYFIPVTNKSYTVEFTVDLYVTDAKGDLKYVETYPLTADIPARNYQNGYSYAFNTELNWKNLIDPDVDPDGPKKIEFTVTEIKGWDDNADSFEFEEKVEEVEETPIP